MPPKHRYILDYSLTRISEDSWGVSTGKAYLGQACIEVSKEEMTKVIEFMVTNGLIETKKAKVKVINE